MKQTNLPIPHLSSAIPNGLAVAGSECSPPVVHTRKPSVFLFHYSTPGKGDKERHCGVLTSLVACATPRSWPQYGRLEGKVMNIEKISAGPVVEGICARLRLPLWACRSVGLTLCMVALGCLVGCGSGGYSSPSPPPANPTPSLATGSLNPSSTLAGGAAFTLTVTGTNFVSTSTVQWNGNARTTMYASSTSLQATIAAADIAAVGTAMVSVATPAPGGGTSSALTFTINKPIPVVTISPTSVTVAAGGQQQFTANVSNSLNLAVTWEVNGTSGGNATVGTISNAGLYIAPTAQASVTISAVSQADVNQSASATLSVLAPHSIGVRPTATIAEFFNRNTGNAFVPRGYNYIRLANLTDARGNLFLAHSTFAVGLYDSNRAETALASMQSSGYNIVTITMEGCCQGTIGDPAGGLNSAYMANVVDFLRRAKTHAIGVVIASQWLPAFGGFTQPYGACFPQFDDINLVTLSSCGVTANKAYFQAFVKALINASAPMDAIFAYEIWNEYYYQAARAPLISTSGTITTANGQTYDMSSQASQQQMMDDGLVYFADQVRASILALDPTALVTISFFPPEGPNPSRIGDSRIIQVYPAIASSTLDYVDLHPYPIVLSLTMDQVVQNYKFVGHQEQKPIIMGEFGAFIWAYPSVTDAAAGMQSWQIHSCAYNFKGWLLWTWDTDEQPELWNGQSSGGAINLALAPTSRPNPCSP